MDIHLQCIGGGQLIVLRGTTPNDTATSRSTTPAHSRGTLGSEVVAMVTGHIEVLTSLKHLMFQQGQSFDTVKVRGSSASIACRHTWCFSEVNASTESKFEVSQGVLLAGILDDSVRSVLWHSQCSMFLRECRSPAHLMFQWGQCYDTVKVWGSAGNVACRHTWWLSEANA